MFGPDDDPHVAVEQLCTTTVGAKLAEATPLTCFGLVAPCDLLISTSAA